MSKNKKEITADTFARLYQHVYDETGLGNEIICIGAIDKSTDTMYKFTLKLIVVKERSENGTVVVRGQDYSFSKTVTLEQYTQALARMIKEYNKKKQGEIDLSKKVDFF